ncbi:hypothetical protein C488_02351 [Natrinema pellirubrum DSM 15624]|uniref:DUF8106 domain-containing protein n=1 Tax=Natrinema pellirubrum (strain DSM 15624 / CIP 106293 / JCM 10476 / NCIMB 786 / 157) TaxID=797303 RepID=L0JHK3_NATP1|nr:hypothetical protein [Natrinema pellirubrum]AGB31025.1 hypothetical protein Natpe_1113 [Natrinema pellirubrum DSM 15624]ELY81130.1 hypothetical protein C488_02351 [Natrinema pellirubrum DSM 15624]
MTRPTTAHDDGTSTLRKVTLFCWECDHSSPIDGDWVFQSRKRCVAYVCPECETTLTKRPRRTDRSRERPSSEPVAAWERAVRTPVTVRHLLESKQSTF